MLMPAGPGAQLIQSFFSRVVCACWKGVVAYDLYQRMFLSAYVHIHMSATNVRARFAELSLF